MRFVNTIAVIGLLLMLTGCERWELDRKMEALCKKDGGVKVYETVTLPASAFSEFGQPLAQYWMLETPLEERLGPDYKYVERTEILAGQTAKLENGEGRLGRTYQAIYRRSDDRLLGTSVSYSRGGGDGFTFGFQPSGNHCPQPRIDIAQFIFIKGN